jgi:hypothetical protein
VEPVSAGPDDRDLDLEARLDALDRRLTELEDVREMDEAWRLWHYACTGGFHGRQAGRHEALDVLTEDATIEIRGMHAPGEGPRGRAAYTAYWDHYYGDQGPLPYVLQTGLDKGTTITGDTAVQDSVQILIMKMRGRPEPITSMSTRQNTFVRTPAGWRVEKTTGTGGYTVPLTVLEGDLNDSSLPD